VSQALHAQLSQLSERYEKLAAKQQQLDAAAQLGALRRAPLVGLTAAALGKLSAVVNALECEVLLIMCVHVCVCAGARAHVWW
tara:strand:+ start:808 stop:1056 length:249 start_codon:yes stop_codon:yes gene_type:complete